MRKQHRGPEFERSADQRVEIGPYDPVTPAPAPPAQQTLLGKLRDRFSRRTANPGPGFTPPRGTERIGRHRPKPSTKKSSPRRRPDFTDPTH